MLTLAELTPYDPFEGLRFGPETCFLTGQPVALGETAAVFAPWLQARYKLADHPIQLLDQSLTTLGALQIPASAAARYRLVGEYAGPGPVPRATLPDLNLRWEDVFPTAENPPRDPEAA